MLFNSRLFLVFFGVVFILYYTPFFSHRLKKLTLLLASYIFYAAWNPPFVFLLWISTVVDWFACKGIHNTRSLRVRRAYLALSLAANLGLLGFFKYGNFLLEIFTQILGAMGVEYSPPAMSIVLPIGISFYTFQTLSYTFDTYLKRSKPWNSFLDYALYVTFFPQLVAGPIVRASEFLPQCLTPKRFDANRVWQGLSLFTLGLFEKVVIADFLMAPVVEKVYNSDAASSSVDAWVGTLAFSVQIFCDFAGYSTCAIGVALCLGFVLPHNFWFPYAAVGFSDFWRRWHMTLSRWLRDYLYVPLGGNRKGPARTYVNLMVTMLLGGLWHGASWTFIFWGGMHGVYLLVERSLRRFGANVFWNRWWTRLGLAIFTYFLVCLTWVLFRASTFEQAYDLLAAMLSPWTAAGQATVLTSTDVFVVVIVVLANLLIHGIFRNSPPGAVASRLPWWLTCIILAVLIAVVLGTSGGQRAFIYFQF